MRELQRIVALYKAIEASLEVEKVGAAGPMTARIKANQILNDQAYFLLCWGQLEAEIDRRCRDAVRRRRVHPDWRIRRGWDLYNPEDRRFSGLSFEDKVKLVLDGQAGRGSPYALAVRYYTARNEIAHGTLRSTRVDVTLFVQDCYLIQSALDRAA